MQRIKRLLAAQYNSYSAVGRCRIPPNDVGGLSYWDTTDNSDALLHKTVLASWDANLVKIYLSAVFLAFLFGRLQSFWHRLFPSREYRTSSK